MQITLLGTGNPIPDARRAGPSTLVRAGGTGGITVLIDCGRGVLMRMIAAGAVPSMLTAVFVTHLHSDHLTDLNDVITMHWVISPVPQTLRIYGPVGTKAFVDHTLAALAPDIQYRLDHHADLTQGPTVEVTEVVPGDEFTLGSDHVGAGQVGVIVGATDQYGYAAEQNKKPINDLHATILHLLGLNHEKLTYLYNGRNMRLTDVSGELIKEIV